MVAVPSNQTHNKAESRGRGLLAGDFTTITLHRELIVWGILVVPFLGILTFGKKKKSQVLNVRRLQYFP